MRRRNKGQEAFISKRRRQRLFVFVLEFLPHPDHRTAGPWLHWLAQLHIKEQHEGSIEQQGIFARLAVAEHAVQVCGSQTSRREATCWPFTLLSHSLSLFEVQHLPGDRCNSTLQSYCSRQQWRCRCAHIYPRHATRWCPFLFRRSSDPHMSKNMQKQTQHGPAVAQTTKSNELSSPTCVNAQ